MSEDIRDAVKGEISKCRDLLDAYRRVCAPVTALANSWAIMQVNDNSETLPKREEILKLISEHSVTVEPIQKELTNALSSLLQSLKIANDQGRDIDTEETERFVTKPDSERVRAVLDELVLVEQQVAVDAAPYIYDIEAAIEKVLVGSIDSKRIALRLENNLRILRGLADIYENAQKEFDKNGNRQSRWEMNHANRNLEYCKQSIIIFSRCLQRRLIAASLTTSLNNLYVLISDWQSRHVGAAIVEVMRAGDLLATLQEATQNDSDDDDEAHPVPTEYEKAALLNYLTAIRKNPALNGAKRREIYDWIKRNELDVDGSKYDCPEFGTWARYVREGIRKARESGNIAEQS